MLGTIIGDIVGSRFEWDNIKTKDFEWFTDDCFVTDDYVMTLAIVKAIMESDLSFEDTIRNAISLDRYSDTLAAITWSVAESYYGIPPKVREIAIRYLDIYLHNILFEFKEKY